MSVQFQTPPPAAFVHEVYITRLFRPNIRKILGACFGFDDEQRRLALAAAATGWIQLYVLQYILDGWLDCLQSVKQAAFVPVQGDRFYPKAY
jgi:hypothetical protein